jgi:hypothetical protein
MARPHEERSSACRSLRSGDTRGYARHARTTRCRRPATRIDQLTPEALRTERFGGGRMPTPAHPIQSLCLRAFVVISQEWQILHLKSRIRAGGAIPDTLSASSFFPQQSPLHHFFRCHTVPCGVSSRMTPISTSRSRMSSASAKSFLARAMSRRSTRRWMPESSPPSVPFGEGRTSSTESASSSAAPSTRLLSREIPLPSRAVLTCRSNVCRAPRARAVLRSSASDARKSAENSAIASAERSPSSSAAGLCSSRRRVLAMRSVAWAAACRLSKVKVNFWR